MNLISVRRKQEVLVYQYDEDVKFYLADAMYICYSFTHFRYRDIYVSSRRNLEGKRRLSGKCGNRDIILIWKSTGGLPTAG